MPKIIVNLDQEWINYYSSIESIGKSLIEDYHKRAFFISIFKTIKEQYDPEKIFINPLTRFKYKEYFNGIFKKYYSANLSSWSKPYEGLICTEEYEDMELIEDRRIQKGILSFESSYQNLG